MARIAYPPFDNLPERLKEELRKRTGPDRGNVWKMMMWSPTMAAPFTDFNDAVRYKLTISDELREIIILRVGRLCEAAYEVHHHSRIGREIGMSEELIAATAVGSSAAGLDATQKLALDMVDDLVKDKRLSDGTFAKAMDTFGPAVIMEIIMLAGCYVMACMFLKTYGIEIEKPA